MTKRQCIKIIEDLEALNALMLVIWQKGSRYPRLWLREWCGIRTSVSIATAEMVRDAILSGSLIEHSVEPSKFRRKLPASTTYIETVFVR